MKRTTIFLPDDLIARIDAESARMSVKPAELIRRCIDATIPPVESSPGDLRKRIDRSGQMKVFVLDARSGRLLVEPGGGAEGLFEPMVQMWVPSNLVSFGETEAKTADLIPAPLLTPLATPPELRLNLMAIGLASPSICGICKQSFPTKAERKRHRRREHPTPEEIADDARSTPPPTGEASEEPKP